MAYQIWYKDSHKVRVDGNIVEFDAKAKAKVWISENIDQASLRKNYWIKKV